MFCRAFNAPSQTNAWLLYFYFTKVKKTGGKTEKNSRLPFYNFVCLFVRRWYWDLAKVWKSCLLAAIAPWDSTKESDTAVVLAGLLHTLEDRWLKWCQHWDLIPKAGQDIWATVFNENYIVHGSALHRAWHNLFVCLVKGSTFSRESEFRLKF